MNAPPKGVERWAFIDKAIAWESDECLLWPYGATRGYGTISLGKRKGYLVTRYVCEQVHGKPPMTGLEAVHSCDVPACINPQHLRWATHSENMTEMYLRGRRVFPPPPPAPPKQPPSRKAFCYRGHPLADPNLYYKANGDRQCRQCNHINAALRGRAKRSWSATTLQA